MSVAVKNLAAFDADVMAWFAAVEEAAAKAAVGLAKTVFNQVLDISPQYSGDFVANWKIQANGITPSFQENAIGGRDKTSGAVTQLFGAGAYGMGDTAAINYAQSMNDGVLDGFKLGGTIYLHNSAAHDEPYAMKIEDGLINLRPVNMGADHVARRALSFVANRNKTIDRSQLEILRRIGT